MSSLRRHPGKNPSVGILRWRRTGRAGFAWLSFLAMVCGAPALAHSQEPPITADREAGRSDPRRAATACSGPVSAEKLLGSLSGTIVDPTGAALDGARVTLAREGPSPAQESVTDDDGQFSFANIAPGPFHLTISSEGFATQAFSGILHPGEACQVPRITLAIAAAMTEVSVVLSRTEVAEAEIKEQEKQRALGFIPNFYVSYVPNAAPLTTKQKFELAWKSTLDPVNFGIVGFIAGLQQAGNYYSGYGQGAQGYAKRYGAGFADSVSGAFIGGAILPSLLKQDPRYFYKGTGRVRSRLLYAIANAVICKSDKGRWQPNYSAILGSVATGGISNLYYPDKERGADLVFENTLVGLGANAVANIFQEFFVRKFTPNLTKHPSEKH